MSSQQKFTSDGEIKSDRATIDGKRQGVFNGIKIIWNRISGDEGSDGDDDDTDPTGLGDH